MHTKAPLHKEAIHLELDIPLELLHYLNSKGSNLQSICRLCLTASKEALSPFPSSKKSMPEEIFLALTTVSINSDDDLPSGICPKCKMELDHFCKFRTKCVKSDYVLRTLLKKGLPVKSEPTDIANGALNDQEIKDVTDIVIKCEDTTDNCKFTDEGMKEYPSEDGLVERVYNLYGDSNDYHDDLQNILSDDEALCIVQNTIENEKKFTIYEKQKDPKVYTDIISPKNRKKKTSYFECIFCPQEFRQARQFKAHQKQHLKEHSRTGDKYNNPYPCMQCKETFHSEFDLSLHGILHKKGPWKCSTCGKDFKKKPAIRRHIKRHMTSKRYSCDACGKTFVELCALKRHARVHTGERAEKKHACTLCDKRFSDSNQLMVHMARHSGSKPFQCYVCGGGFPSARLLRSHRLVHSDLKPYACEYCDKRFRHESTRNTHHRTHTGEKPYVCSICGKSFIQASNLNLHMRVHTGERPYSCTQCESRFSSGSTLKAHQRTHTGEKPYICKICGKCFARVNMKQHLRLHSGDRPYACSACPKKYVSASHLRSHCRTHTGEKPYECAKCQSKFATKTLLIKHLNSKEKSATKAKLKQEQQRPKNVVKKEVVTEQLQELDNDIPNAIVELTLGTHETLDISQELVYQENNVKTHVIVLGSNTVSFVSNDATGESGLNIVTVNEIDVSMSTTNS